MTIVLRPRKVPVIMILFFVIWSAMGVHGNINNQPDDIKPLKVAIIGLVHTHVHWILGREKQGDIEIVGIVEPNRQLAKKYSKQHGYSMDIVYDSMDELYSSVKPDAVTAFTTIYDHLEVVEFFAPKGVHIMVEKPLAINWAHAQEMAKIARKNNVHVLTNYETSWYASNHKAREIVVEKNEIGPIQRIVFHHGHQGPMEIGVNTEFLEWLTDPDLNGAGALTDFGCYGANLSTWLLMGQVPEKVTCITRQYKPTLYPKVDDDATIILDYNDAQVIIQASWNWSHSRKDMEIYGKTGYVLCIDSEAIKVMKDKKEGTVTLRADDLAQGVDDPFAFLAKVVNENHDIEPFGVSSLENNLIVMQILEVAKHSASVGKTIAWDDFFQSNQ